MALNESSNEIVGFFDIDEAKLIDSSEGQAGIVSQLIPSTSVKGLTSLESGVAQFESDVNSGLIGGLRGWSTSVVFSSSAYNSISWTSGTISLSNGIQYNVLSGSLTLTGTHYVYIDTAVSETVLQTTTNPATPVGQTKIMVAMAIVSADVTTKAIIKAFGGQGDSQLISALNIANGAITAAKTSIAAINPADGEINANKVGTTQIQSDAVTGAKILNGAITAAKTNIAAISSATGNLNTGTVGTTQLVDNAVNSLKLLDGAVTAAKTNVAAISSSTGNLNANTVSTAQLVDNAVNSLKLLDGAVTAAKTSIAAIESTTGNLVANSVGTTQITDNAITSQKVTANAIIAGKIAADAVTANTIAANAVVAGKIAADAVTSNTIAANAIVAGKIAANAVTATTIEAGAVVAGKIATYAVTSNTIAANAIVAGKIAANAVTAATIEAGAVTTDKIFAGAVTANKITSYNFVVSAGTFSNNTPAAGDVQWSGVKVVYEGVEYSLDNGYANHKYFYWRKAYPTVMSSLNTLPDLGNDDFLILINNSGTYTLAWNSTRIDGGRITTGSITSTQIAANTIVAANIQSGTITTDKFTANTISGNIISAGTLNADKIVAGSITTDRFTSNSINASVISAGTLTADKLSTSLLYAGSIQISTGGNVRSGQTDYDTGTGWFLGNSGGTPKFSIGTSTTYIKWDGTDLAVSGITTSNATDGIKAVMVNGQSYYENYVSKQRAYVDGTKFRMTQEFADTTETDTFRIVGVNDTSNPRVTMEFYYGLNMRGEVRPISSGLFVGGGDYGLVFKTSSLEPTLAGAYNLGSPTYYYNNLNFQNLAFRNPTISYTGKTLVGYLPITVGTDTRYVAFYS